MTKASPSHTPVLLAEVLHFLDPSPGEIYVDATFGGGGYTRAILEAAPCRVVAIDRDSDAVPRAIPFKEKWGERFDFLHGTFSGLPALLSTLALTQVNGIVFDLGVSSFQLDQEERGFSFSKAGPLDMRMSGEEGESAFELLKRASAEELADILYYYGEERKARPIARALVAYREKQPLETTTQLAALVEKIIPRRPGNPHKPSIHPATRTFQALRIFVNNELKEIHDALESCRSLLAPQGRLVVVSFHSLEDRIIKQFLKTSPLSSDFWEILTPKPVTPSLQETSNNPRARSAKLRAARKKNLPTEGKGQPYA